MGDNCVFWFYSLCDLWCDKFLDFDRRVKFWFVLESKSVDFTGVLLNLWAVNRLVLMCYFFIKYGVFCLVRLKPYFIRVWDDFGGLFWWFLVELEWVKWRKMGVLSKWVSKWCFMVCLDEMSRKCRFYNGFVDRRDIPFLTTGCLF